jgi:hypothetical protein
MVTLYVGGKKVANWNEAEKLFAETARSQRIEFRDESGQVIATSTPEADDDPDWVKAITPEETARRMAEPGFTYEEMKKRLGWE